MKTPGTKWFLLAAAFAFGCSIPTEEPQSAATAESEPSQPLAAFQAVNLEEVVQIPGAGSTFVYPALRIWARNYYREAGVEIVYNAIGSSAGLERLAAGEALFAASDKPLSAEELDKNGYVQWPIIAGGIVPVVNLLVEPGELVLSGEILASVYLGEITTWSDPLIVERNRNLRLPDSPITVVRRGDASGTTYNLADYLAKMSPAFGQQAGVSTDPAWSLGVPGLGNAGVAEFVRQIPNSIGYVNYAYALETELTFTRMVNRSGAVVEPSLEAFLAACRNADYTEDPAMSVMLTNQAGEEAWPIVATTYIVMPRRPRDSQRAEAALDFFRWVFRNGEAAANELRYVSIPEEVWRLAEARWDEQIRLRRSAD